MPVLLIYVFSMQKKDRALNLVAIVQQYILPPAVRRRLLRVAAWLAGVAALALVAAMLLVHVWILPRINDFRPKLEQSASSALGLKVSIGEIAVLRQGWQPAVQLRDIRFLDEAGNEGLHVQAVEAEATVFSLLRGRVARLAVVQPRVHARRSADGRIYIAGVALPQGPSQQPQPDDASSNAALNWLLKQPVLEIRNGRMQWNDAQRQVVPLVISQVQARLNNNGRHHDLQLAFTPPAGWGQPIKAAADWKHGLWREPAEWNKWSGTVQADIAEADVSRLRQYADLGKHVAVRQGKGKLHVQAEYREGLRSSITIRTELQAVDMTLGKDLPPLALKGLQGTFKLRFNQSNVRNSYTLATEGLRFETHDGLRWPGGNLQVDIHDAESPTARGGQIQGNDWDIGVIGQLAGRLPLGEAMLKALRRFQPQGQIQELQISWQGDINAPVAYTARGRANQIGWLAQPVVSGKVQPQATASASAAPKTPQAENTSDIGIPGVQGAQIAFDFNQSGGSMNLSLNKGSAEFPGVFEKPRLEFDSLQTQVQWNVHGQQIRVTLPAIRFANADAQGTVRLSWRTYDGAVADKRFPGILDLDGHMQRARAEQVVRYLPRALDRNALDYVGHAVRGGDIRNARVRIAGDLAQIPFDQNTATGAQSGTFRFEVPLTNAEYHFVPRYLQNAGEKPWPALTKLNGLLVIDKSSLSVLNATARFSSAPDIEVKDLSAHIPDLANNLTVGIAAKMHGPLEQALALTNQSPLSDIIGNSLEQASANGKADISLALGLPIMHMDKAIVKGAVALQGNDIRISPDSPLLAQSQGKVLFNEKGFSLQDTSTTLLGGKASIQGGSVASRARHDSHQVKIEAQGDFTAEGLRQEPSVGTIAQLGRFLQGRSAYRATLFFNRGASELTIDSDLAGMDVKLPAPLGKGAAGKLPFHFSSRIIRSERAGNGADTAVEDELQVRFGHVVLAQYARDLRHGNTPQVLRGRVAVGAQAVRQPPPMPETGVHALVLMDRVNADAWSQVLESGWGDQLQITVPHIQATATTATNSKNANSQSANSEATTGSYLPDQFAMQTPALAFADRVFESLVVGGAREGRLWKLSLVAKQLNGYVEFLQSANGGAGSIKARLQHLTLAPASVQEVGEYVRQTANPKTLPALDIDASHVDLVGYKFDRIALRASNSAQARLAGTDLADDTADRQAQNAWRIHELTASTPQARLSGSGMWGVHPSGAGGELQPADLAKRFVSLQLRAQTDNLGSTLNHFGHKDLLKSGQGSVAGTLRWEGSPVAFDMETLAGELRVDIRRGHISRIDTGALKLISLLSLQGLTRLGDISEKGFAFDRIDGSLHIQRGIVKTDNLAISGSMADAKMSGKVALANKTIDLNVVVQPKVDLSTAALAVGVINPLVGVGSYVAQWALSKPISAMATQVLRVHGPLNDPTVTRLQGTEATQAEQHILKGHGTPAAFNPLWDWTPITGRRQRETDVAADAEQAQDSDEDAAPDAAASQAESASAPNATASAPASRQPASSANARTSAQPTPAKEPTPKPAEVAQPALDAASDAIQ